MHGHPALVAMVAVSALLVTLCEQETCASEDVNPTAYQVTIDGIDHQIRDGQEMQIDMPDGKSIKVMVRLYPTQTYRTNTLRFDYDAALSLEDDKAAVERTIVLLHASGCGIVITDQGPARGVNKPQVLNYLVDRMLARIRRGVANEITTGATKRAAFRHAEGISTTSTHLDKDNDLATNRYYVLQYGSRLATVIGFHTQDSKNRFEEMETKILESLQQREITR